jgi:hypothetical protein
METRSDELRQRRAVFYVSPEALMMLTAGTFEVVENGLPGDARFVGANYDYLRNAFAVCVESASFEETPESQMFPVITGPCIRRIGSKGCDE